MDYNDPTGMLPTYTLSQFSQFVTKAISRQPELWGAWVIAEISDMSVRGGHCYMTLIEKDASGVTIARMRATIWANVYATQSRDFKGKTGQNLANGMKVRFYGGVNYHINFGLSFNIGAIDASYTMGDLERIRREILETLRREGILGHNRQLRVTQPPLKVAIISSETAAGYGDFINQLEHNQLGIQFYTMLFPAVMQGERTAPSVEGALGLVERTLSVVAWDCVVIIRGGGATTDMNGFDNLDLARKVATYPIPVVVGIGHERDRCVLDEIACVRCKTPTAAAAWLTDTAGAFWQRSSDLAMGIATFAAERMRGEHIRMQGIETMIPAATGSLISNASLRLRSISAQLPIIANAATSEARSRLTNTITTIRLASETKIDRHFTLLDNLAASLKLAITTKLDKEQTYLLNMENLVSALNPEATLKRGYSITRLNGKSIKSPSDVSPGDIVATQTAGGEILSKVQPS